MKVSHSTSSVRQGALLLAVCYQYVSSLSDASLPAIFYPFGTDVGDSIAPVNDDGYTSAVTISYGFPFFNSSRSSLYVNTNGGVSFGAGIGSFTPTPFPIPASSSIAVWWTDVDTRVNSGRVYYRETQDATLLQRANDDVLAAFRDHGFFFFRAAWMFVATWHNVTYYKGSSTSPIQSFQAVLVTDGVYSFVMFNFGKITWTRPATYAETGSAQVGFNAGDAVNYYVVPWSRTDQIANVANTSNIDRPGRWMFRTDSATIAPPKETSGPCAEWQQLGPDGRCVDIAPKFDSVRLSGPRVVNRQHFEFRCIVETDIHDGSAVFEITFLFNGEPGPRFFASPANPSVILHERHLHGHIGKSLSCSALSYWNDESPIRSRSMTSNHYRLAIEASTYAVHVSEQDLHPFRVVLKSTVPITCQTESEANAAANCKLVLTIYSGSDIIAGQHHPDAAFCEYVITDRDWHDEESLAYNMDAPLQITAKEDSFSTSPRQSKLTFVLRRLRDKRIGGEQYTDPWDGYKIKPHILVYRYDSPHGVCSSSGDPRISTFDGFYYSTYSTGQFIYARSTSGVPFEVHVRHWPCTRAVVSCVCGVAMREGDVILGLDMCTDGIVHTFTYNSALQLPEGFGIHMMETGRMYKIEMQSGSKVLAHVYPWGMNIMLYMSSKIRTEGLCGSLDGNPQNDLKVQGTDVVMMELKHGQAADEVVRSWRLPDKKSLFDGVMVDLSRGDAPAESTSTFCPCDESGHRKSAFPASNNADNSVLEPQMKPVKVKRVAPMAGPLRRRKRETLVNETTDDDDYDLSYNPGAFNESRDIQLNISWPTSTGIDQSEAEAGCRQRIVNVTTMGQSCFDRLGTTDTVETVVRKCVDDVQISGDFSWADDKVAEVQQSCIDDVIMRNYTDLNDTESVMSTLVNEVTSVTAHRCVPFDCSQHGQCVNGSCVCDEQYSGSDCSIVKSSPASVVRLLDLPNCDARRRRCRSVSMVTANVAVSTARCKIFSVKMDGSRVVYNTSAEVTSLQTTTCSLPLEPLSLCSNNVNFSLLGGQEHQFERLPQGGALLTYTILLSNDGEHYSNGQTMRVVDTLCMECRNEDCTQKPDTCLIKGYCFASGDANPFDENYTCQPEVTRSTWTRTGGQNPTFALIVSFVSAVVVIIGIALGIVFTITARTLRQKMMDVKFHSISNTPSLLHF